AGDFSRLAPLFERPAGGDRCPIIQWHEAGQFAAEPQALDEAFTCACFLGRTEVAEHFLAHGVSPSGGAGTGLNAFHWASNRGQMEVVRLLIRHRAPLEPRTSYGGTVLGGTVWAAAAMRTTSGRRYCCRNIDEPTLPGCSSSFRSRNCFRSLAVQLAPRAAALAAKFRWKITPSSACALPGLSPSGTRPISRIQELP